MCIWFGKRRFDEERVRISERKGGRKFSGCFPLRPTSTPKYAEHPSVVIHQHDLKRVYRPDSVSLPRYANYRRREVRIQEALEGELSEKLDETPWDRQQLRYNEDGVLYRWQIIREGHPAHCILTVVFNRTYMQKWNAAFDALKAAGPGYLCIYCLSIKVSNA